MKTENIRKRNKYTGEPNKIVTKNEYKHKHTHKITVQFNYTLPDLTEQDLRYKF